LSLPKKNRNLYNLWTQQAQERSRRESFWNEPWENVYYPSNRGPYDEIPESRNLFFRRMMEMHVSKPRGEEKRSIHETVVEDGPGRIKGFLYGRDAKKEEHGN
jgi:hypothetical protein